MRIFFSLLLAVILCSCKSKIEKCEDGQAPFIYINYFEHDSHEYINFNNGYNNGIVHNPDCKYCKTKK